MNKALRDKVRQLIQRDETSITKEDGRLSARLTGDYLEKLYRLSVIESCSQTEMIRRLIDRGASQYDGVLYPLK